MTAKADKAKKLLEDELLAEAFEKVRENYLNSVEALPLDRTKGDEAFYDLRVMLYLLRRVKDELHQYIKDGTLVDFRAEQRKVREYHGRSERSTG